MNITGTLTIESFPGDNTMVTKVYRITESDGVSDPSQGFMVAYGDGSREPDEITITKFGENDD